MKKLILILGICYSTGCSQVFETKGTKTVTATKPEVYHVMDPQGVGFNLIINCTSFTVSSNQELVRADVDTAFIDNYGNPSNDGKRFPLELVTRQISNGILRSKKFGDIKLKANNLGYMEISMTDKQMSLIRAFLGR